MNDLPQFETPPAPPAAPDTPKKPRRKPMKKRRKTAKAAAPKKTRRKRRKRVKIAPTETTFPSDMGEEVYRLIGALMHLETPLRSFVIEVTRALDK